jgi:beta-1,4-mannooligosaccharide/beta-1,4-mannosyl-N-acetylglucosamine phosphorylase
VFPCGWILDKASGEIRIYYGGADSCVALATAKPSDLLDYLRKSPAPPERKRKGMTLLD